MLLFEQILNSAKEYNLPTHNREMLLVQYLQCEILDSLYKLSPNLHFIGGTCLCIIYGLPRFSEDLDFYNFALKKEDFEIIIDKLKRDLGLKGFQINFRMVFKDAYHCYFKFNKLLHKNKLSPYKDQKILIRLDATRQKIEVKREVKLLSRFGVSREILTNPLSTLMSQKIMAMLERKRAKGRDFFDFLWLNSLTQPDFNYLKQAGGISDWKVLRRRGEKRFKNINFKSLAQNVEKFLFNRSDLDKVVNFKKYFEHIVKEKV